MPTLITSLAAINQTPLDWNGNLNRIFSAIKKAHSHGANFLCTPELCLTGYGCEDYFFRPDIFTRSATQLSVLANFMSKECPLMTCAVGLPVLIEGEAYNCLAIIQGNRIAGIIPKTHLARDGIHYEPRWFRAWELGKIGTLHINGHNVPVGNLVFNQKGFCFSFEICEDAWVPDENRPCRLYSKKIHAVFNASASHFSLEKAHQRDHILMHSSETFGVHYYYANLLGCESGRAIYDGELMVAHAGEIINRSPRLGLEEITVLSHKVSFQAVEIKDSISLLSDAPTQKEPPSPTLVRSFPTKNHEFAAAASLGLFDYMRKSRSKGFTISLSGGVDSAVCVILASMTRHRVESLLKLKDHRLAYLNGSTDPLITTVYQSTRNSGEITRNAAADLARALDTQHFELDVDPIVESYKSLISKTIKRELTWKEDDLALQNIQARTRGPSVWMLANLTASLLLTTSNRSEVAVGYATMDGDTCGGLAPIAGVEKTFLRNWLKLLEVEDMPFCPKIPELKSINLQAPTAELRPPAEHQSDEADLMPYEVLDHLEECFVLKKQTPEQAFLELQSLFSEQWTSNELKNWTIRFLRLFSMSQWKRERYAPSFHLDDRSLDPKTWARFPILSGNFSTEIKEFKDGLDL